MSTEPQFIMVPPLYEESRALISWESMKDAREYELDIVFNESFDSAYKGKSWANLSEKDWAWDVQEGTSAISWEGFSNLEAQGLMWRNWEFKGASWSDINENVDGTWQWIENRPVEFTVYRGEGSAITATDQGLTWSDYKRASPDNLSDKSWQEYSEIPSVGLHWNQHNSKSFSWQDIESIYQSWATVEELTAYGLSWKSKTVHWLSWQEISVLGENSQGLTWEDIENLPADNKTHRGFVVDIPLYTKYSMFRVRETTKDGNAGPYKTTSLIKHNPRSLKKYAPPCLHIPKLYEGREAEIVWGDLYGASGYVLERKFGIGFEKCYDGAGYNVAHPKGCQLPKNLYYEPDCKKHLACTNAIPYYQKNVTYQIKGYNATDSSGYVKSLEVTIIPVFYRDDTLSFNAIQGQSYMIQLCASKIRDFENIWMSLEYSANQIGIEQMVRASNIGAPVFSHGKMGFQCGKSIPNGEEWTGLVMMLQVKALVSGIVKISLM